MQEKLGYIGLGTMGSRMARRLLEQGQAIVVHDLDASAMQPLAAAGATAASSPAEVARAAGTVLLCLPSVQAAKSVIFGASGLVEGGVQTVVDLSTSGVTFSRETQAALAGHGIAFLEAPISGGAPGAAAGTLSVMASGPRPVFDRLRPVLDIIGSSVFYMGEKPGLGQAMKLINNLLSTTALAITCEGMVLGAKAGLDPDLMIEVLNASTGRNSATGGKMPRAVLPRSFVYGGTYHITMKDLDLCLDEAEALRVPLLLAHSLRQVWKFAMAQANEADDNTTLIKYYEKMAGVEVRGRAAP